MSKLTREEKITILVAQDIISIKRDIEEGDFCFLSFLLRGEDGVAQYNNLTDNQLDIEIQERWDDIADDSESLELAHELNGEPIDLLKV